ncbi:tubulin polyglutamylase complex subunit 2 [Daktulosphaira vitifoliae]|uniref:tubulin polyglutamylase complex subunit 2 n=1 Tax=Daktulosphaira vitifoliae TaxID=58002 RepID=UPI0021AA8569|nr:tubulin polyglutamylase complex subunit 2 [Daktulosphaira vitifoliae]
MTNKLDSANSDLFLEQLTLGLLGVLENTAGVNNLNVTHSLPCDNNKISSWEQYNGCSLPDDLRHFYASCDGFKLTWSYKLDGILSDRSSNANLSIGNITINPLSALTRLCDIKSDCVSMSVIHDLQILDRLSDENSPKFTDNTKMFELDSSLDIGHICLVYFDETNAQPTANQEIFNLHEEPSGASIWLLDTSYCWHFLAPNFSNYFRKALVHMGLLHWQLKFTEIGLTPIGEFFMNLVAPHLNVTERVQAISQFDHDDSYSANNTHINHFDPNILKNTFKTVKSKKSTTQSKSNA